MADDANKNNSGSDNGGNAGDDKNKNNSQNNDDKNKGKDNGGKNDGGNGDGNEPQIPKSRFDEETKKRREAEDKLAKIEADRKKKEDEDLAKRGEFETLAKQREEELTNYKQSQILKDKRNALKMAGIEAGTVDKEALAQLADLEQITVDDDGNVDESSVKALVDKMKEEKPYLFGEGGEGNTNIGSRGGAPANGNQTKTFKRSQLRDSAFYAENETEILKALREGRIIDDVTPKKK